VLARQERHTPRQGVIPVADLGFVVLTVIAFVALAVLIRAVERW